jgi:hypothetical protein
MPQTETPKTAQEEGPTQPKKKNGLIITLVIVVILALAAFGSWSYYSYYQAKQKLSKLSTPEGQTELAQREVDLLLARIKEHMVLPEDEEPTIASVTDVEALKKTQPFFEKAQNGDRVLVYTKAGKAIIFSPERDLIVNVGAVAIDQAPPEVAGTEDEAANNSTNTEN